MDPDHWTTTRSVSVIKLFEQDLTGRSLLHYRIVEKIGQGGMGVVYRAEDSHLKRPVAIKVLPPDRIADPERKRRFVREARAASALNHPNIVTIHDINQADGIDFIAMEYVAGQTLDRKIPKKGIPTGEVLKLSIQMAAALAAAHSAGIVHRDLKPANVMVGASGQVKILDFGLAKLLEKPEPGAAGNAPADRTESTLHTQEGLIVGSAAYMSPEQAQGRKLDARSDIFSFGAVLYEMATGQRAFEGDSAMSTLAAIIRDEPKPLREIAPRVPAQIEKLVSRCLRKEPARRYQSIADIRVELQELEAEISKDAARQPVTGRLRKRAFWLSTVAAGILLAAVTYWLASSRQEMKAPSTVERPLRALTSGEGLQDEVTWSPDGKYIAYTAGETGDYDILVKEVGGGEPGRLKGADDPRSNDWEPNWSPVSKQIVFRSERQGGGIYMVSAPFGGPASRLLSYGFLPRWSPDGQRILFLETVAPVSTGPKVLFLDRLNVKDVPVPEEAVTNGLWSARWHPDGRVSIFAAVMSLLGSTVPRFWTQALDGSGRLESGMTEQVAEQIKRLQFSYPEFEWAPSRDAIFFVASAEGVSDLWRVDVDPKTLQWVDGPHRLTTGPDSETALSISRSGDRLAFCMQRVRARFWSLPLDRDGAVSEGSRTRVNAPNPQGDFDLSADGKKLTYVTEEPGTGQRLWAVDLQGDVRTLLAEGSRSYFNPRWSRDSKYVAYSSQVGGAPTQLFAVPAAGGQARLVLQLYGILANDWFPDGESILAGTHGGEIVKLRAFSPAPRPDAFFAPGPRDAPRLREKSLVFATDRNAVLDGRLSPSGRWVSFTAMQFSLASVRGKSEQVFVAPAVGESFEEKLGRVFGLRPGEVELARVLLAYLKVQQKSVEQIAREFEVSEKVVRREMDRVLSRVNARSWEEVFSKFGSAEVLVRDWVPISDDVGWNTCPRWSSDGRTLYFVSIREGSVNVWGRRFDPEQGKPIGEAFRVTRLSGPGQTLVGVFGVGPQRLVMPLMEVTGNLWVLENLGR